MAETKVKKTTKKTVTEKAEASVKAVKPMKEAKGGLNIDVYNAAGALAGSVDLPEEIFGAKVNKQLIAQAVRVYLANQREGSASTLTRGQVRGSTRKIYRQKGTGRARHGGVRAPIFVHGGIAHGPKPKDFRLILPQKMRRAALFSTLSLKVGNGQVKVVDGLESMEPKTKNMVTLLGKLLPETKMKNILVVMDVKQDNVIRATRNVEGVTYEMARQLNAYEVMNTNAIVFTKKGIEAVKEAFLPKETK